MNTVIKQINQDGKEYAIHSQLFENTAEIRTLVFHNGEIIYETISPKQQEVAGDIAAVQVKPRKDVMFEFLEGEIRRGRMYL